MREDYTSKERTWADVEYSYARGSYFPRFKTGIKEIDEPWIKYEKE